MTHLIERSCVNGHAFFAEAPKLVQRGKNMPTGGDGYQIEEVTLCPICDTVLDEPTGNVSVLPVA
jgi:hypothetical protein